MTRNILSGKGLIVLAVALALAGLTFAGEGCKYDKGESAKAAYGEHCPLSKGVTKTAQLTDDGAIVTLKAKNEKSIEHLKAHFALHEKGEACPDCVLSMTGVTTRITETDDGGVLTVTASTPEALKAVQEWANGSETGCCAKGGHVKKA